MNNHDTQHEFAFYYPNLASFIKPFAVDAEFSIQDKDLYHRIVHVLRLQVGEVITLFDQAVHALCVIQALQGKQKIVLRLQGVFQNQVYKLPILFILPLLKRDDCQKAIYSLVECGATEIQLVYTKKSQQSWGQKKELPRLERIMIAAAEQSKNFAFPNLRIPLSLDNFLVKFASRKDIKIFFDSAGMPLAQVVQSISSKHAKGLMLMIGPEGDLVPEEKDSIKQADFIFCALTPTVLRAAQAAAIGTGIFRSFFSS